LRSLCVLVLGNLFGHGGEEGCGGIVAEAKTPVRGPKAPTVIARTKSSIKLSWDGTAPESAQPTNWNLILDGVSVYSGSETIYQQSGLPEDTCFEFRTAYWDDGAWSRFGDPKRISTTKRLPLDIALLDEEGERLREMIESAAISNSGGRTCALEGLQAPSYVHSDVHSVHWVGIETPLAEAGIRASQINCLVSECNRASSLTTSRQEAVQGHVFLRLDNGMWKQRYISLEPGNKVLEMNDPIAANLKMPIELHGCRANPLNTYAQEHAGKVGDAAAGCFQLNCTLTQRPWYFCGGSGGGDGRLAQATAKKWIAALNRHSHGTHVIQRYEVSVRTTIVNGIIADRMNTYRESAWREAWQYSFTNRLQQAATSPHFPRLFAAYKCLNLPIPLRTKTGEQLGDMPHATYAADTVEAVEVMKASGGSYETQWAVVEMEAYSVTLADIMASYKDYALSVAFVRGVIAQLVQGLGVARAIFGFHHNDLLTLSNVRFRQIPRENPERKTHWCYQFTAEAFTRNDDFSHVGDPASVLPTTNFTLGEIDVGPDACDTSEKAMRAREQRKHREVWSKCVPMDDVDGLLLQLHGLSSSSLVQTELAYWAKGFTFANTPWEDDMVSVGVIMCDMLGRRVAEWPKSGDALCEQMKNGTFANNPLLALKEPFFEDLPNSTSLPKDAVETYTYFPPPSESNDATKKKKKNEEKNGDKEGKKNGTGSGPDAKNDDGRRQKEDASSAPEISATTPSPAQQEQQPVTEKPDICARSRPSPPWVVSKDSDGSLHIEWNRRPEAEVYELTLNGVSVYSGTGTEYKAAGVNLRKCYRFQVAYFSRASSEACEDGWSGQSPQLYVNDCTAVRSKLCREGGCEKGGSNSLSPDKI